MLLGDFHGKSIEKFKIILRQYHLSAKLFPNYFSENNGSRSRLCPDPGTLGFYYKEKEAGTNQCYPLQVIFDVNWIRITRILSPGFFHLVLKVSPSHIGFFPSFWDLQEMRSLPGQFYPSMILFARI